jgi:predicted DNA-binding transcriptional regulator YafY
MYKRGDYGQVARAMRILDELRGFRQGRTLSELAKEVGASERTIKRDVDELIDAGIDIQRTTVDGRIAMRLVEHNHSYVAITRRERYTLLAIRSMFDVLRGTPLWEDVQSVHRKLEQRMSPEERAEYATFGNRFAYIPDGGTKAYEGKEDILDALLTGVLSRRVVRFTYRDGRGRTSRGHLAPFAMLLYKHGLYVVGRRLRHPEDGTAIADGRCDPPFAVERFTDADAMRGSPFVPPSDFQLSTVVHAAGGVFLSDPLQEHEVAIEFSREKATYVLARSWFAGQRSQALPDGRVLLTFRCPNLEPIVSWALEWGPHARVVGPEDLVRRVIEELEAARAQYDQLAADSSATFAGRDPSRHACR